MLVSLLFYGQCVSSFIIDAAQLKILSSNISCVLVFVRFLGNITSSSIALLESLKHRQILYEHDYR